MRGTRLHAREVHGKVDLRLIVFRGHRPGRADAQVTGLPLGLAPIKWLTNAIQVIAMSCCSTADVAFQ